MPANNFRICSNETKKPRRPPSPESPKTRKRPMLDQASSRTCTSASALDNQAQNLLSLRPRTPQIPRLQFESSDPHTQRPEAVVFTCLYLRPTFQHHSLLRICCPSLRHRHPLRTIPGCPLQREPESPCGRRTTSCICLGRRCDERKKHCTSMAVVAQCAVHFLKS